MPNNESLAMPKGPRFRASRLATTCLALSASIAIAGCGDIKAHKEAHWKIRDQTIAIAERPPESGIEVELARMALADGVVTRSESAHLTAVSEQRGKLRDTDGNPKGGDATQAPSDSLTAGAEGIAQGGSHD